MTARVTSRLLVIAGVALLGWCALVLVDGWIAQSIARQSLDVPAAPLRGVVAHTPAPVPAVSPTTASPARGAALATLSLPRVGLSAVVLQGSDATTLRHGPGHLEGTALPGEPGNDVIAGHRDSFFRPLRNVAVGDDVFLDGPGGRAHYRVAWARVVHPREVSVMKPSEADVLTLVTCYPFWVLGSAPDRFVVRATRVDAPVATAGSPPPQAPVLTDKEQIEDAVGRFRVAYDERIATRRDSVPGAPLAFTGCAVSVHGDAASAACGGWEFALERRSGRWAIRSAARRD